MLFEKSHRKAVKERSATKKVERAAKKANRATKTN
jgi:hypothetical protein